jgi:hypothetical protein
MKTTKPEQIAVALYGVGRNIADAMLPYIPAADRPAVARQLLDRLVQIQGIMLRAEHETIFMGAVASFGYRIDPDVPSGLIDNETDEDIVL